MNWKFYFSSSVNPWDNLALENVWMEETLEHPVFLGYFNAPSAIIGKNQNLFQELNLPYLYENHLPIVRRTSGGGTVYHDLGCLNLSFITPHRTEWVGKWDFFFAPIIQFLKSKGFDAFTNPRNSLMVNGSKVGGSAQKVSRGRMISHCSLLFHTNLQALQNALEVQDHIESKASPSVRAKVMNLESTGLFPENSEDIFHAIKSIYEMEWGTMAPIEGMPDTQQWSAKKIELESESWRFGRNPAFTCITKSGHKIHSEGHSMITSIEYGNQRLEVNISPFHEHPWEKISTEFIPVLKEVIQKWRIRLDLENSW